MTIRPDHMRVVMRLAGPFQAAYIRALMRSAKLDEALAKQAARLAPQQERMARERIAELQVHLIDAELGQLRKLIV
jgi:hypothetical protein